MSAHTSYVINLRSSPRRPEAVGRGPTRRPRPVVILAVWQRVVGAAAQRAPRVFGGRWEVIKRLGQGGQGTAYLVRDLTTDSQVQWVLTELRDDKWESRQRRQKRLLRFEREIAALDRLKQSPHIPPVVDFHVGPEASYLVRPYVGKNLEKLRNVVEPQAVLQRFRGIVDAVKYANDREVVHRDIKPNNVTVNDDGTPYLVDFGICAYDESEVGLTSTKEGFGNRYFAAPECDAGSVDDAREPSDIYSLGKLLYWMVSGRGKMGREEFDEDKSTFTDRIPRQYISVLMKHTVREGPGARWTASELLERIDWTLDKLTEHAAIRKTGLVVLADGFGPNDTCYESSSRSATRGRGNPPADYELAESFFVSKAVTLDRLDIGVTLRHGSGQVEVTLIKGGDEIPLKTSEDVVEQWHREIAAQRNTLEVLQLPSRSGKTLGPQEVYWLKLSARGEDTDVAWISAAIELMPRVSRLADRARPNEWSPRVSVSGPGLSLRVLARPRQP